MRETLFDSEEFLTVSKLNHLIQDVIQMGFPQSVWVCGEIQGFDRNRDKRHVFFELCEKDEQTKDIIARIGLVIFSNRREHIKRVLSEAQNAFDLKDDIEVKFLCKVDFYPPHGSVRLIVDSIDPVYTLGKIAQEKQKLIARLRGKGVLDKNKQVEFPLVPIHIGLITAFDSAAYNDFISELTLSRLGFRVYHKSALMQGKNAETSVCEALNILSKIKILDVIVITRGGGSLAELSCFDSERIAHKIAASRIPVLSGIGHEINITITDLAAHTYQKTPTAIARFLVEHINGFMTQIDGNGRRILDLSTQQLKEAQRNLREDAFNLREGTRTYLKKHHQKIQDLIAVIRLQPIKSLKVLGDNLLSYHKTICKAVKISFKNYDTQLGHFQRMIDLAKPQNTLKRGFSITRTAEGRLLRSIKNVHPSDKVTTQLSDGKLESQIYFIKKGGK